MTRPAALRRAVLRALLGLVIVAAVVGVVGGGCGGSDRLGDEPDGDDGAHSSAPPERLVTLAPNLTEIAFALGLGDRVVGVGDHASWPPEVDDLPRLGGLFDPHLEAMVRLEPDLALVLPSQADVAADLQALGIEVLSLEVESLADVEEAMLTVGRRCGVPDRARQEVEALRRSLAPRSAPAATEAPRVLLSIGRGPGDLETVLAAGPGTFLDELLERLGAENAFADAPLRYPQVGAEEILGRAPEVIVELHAGPLDAAQRRALVEDWQRLPGVPAVETGRIRVVVGPWTLVPGPRAGRLYEALDEALFDAPVGDPAGTAPEDPGP